MSFTPCKDCPNKGCGVYHDECTDYQAWVREQTAFRESLRGEKDAKDFIINRVFDTKELMRKFRGR